MPRTAANVVHPRDLATFAFRAVERFDAERHDMMLDQRNLIIAIVLSIAIVLGFEFLYNAPRLEKQRALEAERAKSQATTQAIPAPGAPTPAQPAPPGTPAVGPATAVPVESPRVQIDTPDVSGSIALVGARIDDLLLRNYRETTDRGSPPIRLLVKIGTASPYFVEHGWVSTTQGVVLPGPATRWTADRDVLRPGQPVTLAWDNGQGLRFERRYEIEGEFLFRVTQKVSNTGTMAVDLLPYALISRTDTPPTLGFFILHEGPIAVISNTLREPNYSDLQSGKPIEEKSTGGWAGFSDKYWLTAVMPEPQTEVKIRFAHSLADGRDKYQADFLGQTRTVAPGAAIEHASRVFGGAKEVRLLDRYADQFGIDRFDLAVDFGWFYFLTKPIFLLLDFFFRLLGNFGLAILLLTVLIKLLFFPLANKSYRAMNKMKLLQPEMEKLRERYGEDRQRMSQEMMALYKRVGANPMAGCLPIVIQIPVFFALYKVLFVTIEMRHAPFYGWIRDLSASDPTSIFNLFGLLPWGPPELYLLGGSIGAWPIIMGVTMFLQQKMSPQPPDPMQAKIFLALPFVFTIMLAPFPAGLVIYWAWNNVLSVLQQWVILKRMGQTPAGGAKTGGGAKPVK
ncbi:MAG TPA: membrane protein insertase YidC [Alphaproteobacteria bacterium]|nr:membrane protein insertase YidC [Alphaproteobacteria bacterium]